MLQARAEQGRCSVLSWLSKFDSQATDQNLKDIQDFLEKMRQDLPPPSKELPRLIAILESKSGVSRLLDDMNKMDKAIE